MNPPYTHCPFCERELIQKPFGGYSKRFLFKCPVWMPAASSVDGRFCEGDYVQNHTEDGELDYISFNTPKYLVHIYFNEGIKSLAHNSTLIIGTYIYSRKVLREEHSARPLAVIKKNDYDFSDWNRLMEKIHTYVVML